MISGEVRKYLQTIGSRGGSARAQQLSPQQRTTQARSAIITRWTKQRFGVPNFEELAIPGWEIVDAGLRDLASGTMDSVNALAVAELRPRLRLLGVPVPKLEYYNDSRTRLYARMQEQHGAMSFARFCALLERIDSFCDSLAALFPAQCHSAHRQRRWYN